jgi:hypothetical protein
MGNIAHGELVVVRQAHHEAMGDIVVQLEAISTISKMKTKFPILPFPQK